jgi:hypothetical protein
MAKDLKESGSAGSRTRMQRLTDKYIRNLNKSGEGEDGGLSTKKQWKAKGKAQKADKKQQAIIAKTKRKEAKARAKGKTNKAEKLGKKVERQEKQSVQGSGLKYNPRRYG